MLFNIYKDNVLKTLVSEFSDIFNIYKKDYAEDVVFILKQKHLNSFIATAKKVFQKFGLILNENKSQVFIMKKIIFTKLSKLKPRIGLTWRLHSSIANKKKTKMKCSSTRSSLFLKNSMSYFTSRAKNVNVTNQFWVFLWLSNIWIQKSKISSRNCLHIKTKIKRVSFKVTS